MKHLRQCLKFNFNYVLRLHEITARKEHSITFNITFCFLFTWTFLLYRMKFCTVKSAPFANILNINELN